MSSSFDDDVEVIMPEPDQNISSAASCDIRNWIRNIEQHASDNVVPTSKGQPLADEYGIKFFETVSGSHEFYQGIPFLFLIDDN
ncbi:hypothetical protein PR202_gb00172 [Eleusine coracana subsp. coracana]|uniref:Uncharacterized protein n=1 Tax=Eleusine coracana subsp. coracana TaxID=191504 RepID=A0AAV5DRY5_ELECO|nr:hypothetical protein PR202_gb00172 [Eleusine coracana subsp. coracana]